MQISGKHNLPRNVVLHLTENCNLRCKMCYFWGETGAYSSSKLGGKPMSLELELVKQIIHDLTPSKPFYSLFGGEPLLYPFIEEVICAIKEAGSIIDTPTNGTLLAEHAKMLVRNGFDLVRVSIDGPREITDELRGKGSHDKAFNGIEALHEEKLIAKKKRPYIGILYTVTPKNYHSIEQFFLEDLNLSAINNVSIQMQNFLTAEMGSKYAEMIRSNFGITSDSYWKGFIRSTRDFNDVDTVELARQVNKVVKHLKKIGKNFVLEPPTFSPENLKAYVEARWNDMSDTYVGCLVPWISVDITAAGDVAPCHAFYDLVLGNLYENNIEEIWNGENYQKFRTYMRKNKLMSICPGCCILYLAGKKKRKKNRND